jgi:hypothetical protein
VNHQLQSPTLQALQNHLVELQIYLRQRDEARVLQELASRQLDSIEAQFRRDKEIEEARLKSEHEARMQQERMCFEQQEAERARQHQQELERQRVEAERRAAGAKMAQEREFAESRKQAQEKFFQEQIARQQKSAEERVKEEVAMAMDYLDRFKLVNSEVTVLFKESLDPLLREQTSADLVLRASHKIKKIENSVRSVWDFLEALSALGYQKEMIAEYLAILSADDFLEVAPKLSDYLKKVPAVGMVDCVAMDERGLTVPPWSLHDAVAWLHPSNGLKVLIGTEGSGVSRAGSYSQAVAFTTQLNTKRLCGSDGWRLPQVTDLQLINFANLDSIGVNVPNAFWIEHARAEGRLSAFDRKNGRRIVTGSADKFHYVFVSV